MAITLSEAKALEHGKVIYHAKNKNADGSPQRWRVNGKPKTWRSMPERVKIPVASGLKTYDYLTEPDLDLVCLKEWQALGEKITFRTSHKIRFAGYSSYMVVLGKIKVPYKNKYVDREIGEVWKDTRGQWYHGQSKHWFKTRQEAAVDLLNTMLD